MADRVSDERLINYRKGIAFPLFEQDRTGTLSAVGILATDLDSIIEELQGYRLREQQAAKAMTCQRCDGEGCQLDLKRFPDGVNLCPTCKGTGQVPDEDPADAGSKE